MTTQKFMIKIITKIFAYAIISIIALLFLTASPIISNELALGQMENSNELYLVMETYNKTQLLISIIYGCISVLFTGSTICDINKFIKTNKNEGEN